MVRNDGVGAGTLRCVRVNVAGQILDSADIPIGDVTYCDAEPRLAYGHNVYFVTTYHRYVSWLISPTGQVLDSVECSYGGYRECGFDGSNFLMLCMPDTSDDFPAMRVTPAGVLLDSAPFPLVSTPGTPGYGPDIGLTTNDQGTVGVACRDLEPEPWLTNRVRASVFPALAGIDASAVLPVRSKILATVVRSVLILPEALGDGRSVGGAQLLDISGRKVLNLHAGVNDVRSLASGVYFVREASSVRRDASCVRKLVLTD